MSLAFAFAGSVERCALALAFPASVAAICSCEQIFRCVFVPMEAMRSDAEMGPLSVCGRCRGHDAFVGEPRLVAKDDRVNFHAGLLGQIGGCVSDPSDDKPNGVASIPSLRFPGGPKAIIRTVGSVVVSSIKGHPLGSVAHIFSKVPERHPTFANRDTAPAVVVERLVRRAKTPPAHVVPCAVERVVNDSIFHGLPSFFGSPNCTEVRQ